MNKLQSVIINSAIGYFSNYVKQDKNPVIEPLSCMIRLAILSFKPVGTKICIFENSVYIQEPSLLQGPIRWIGGDKRNDIHYLLDPINKALKKYDLKNNISLQNIFNLSVDGLKKLKRGYNKNYSTVSSLTGHSIELYIGKIQDLLNQCQELQNTSSQTDIDEALVDKNDDIVSKPLVIIPKEKINNEELNSIWNNEQIDIINYLFIQCSQNHYESESYLKAIENILDSKIKSSKELLVRNMNNAL